MLMQGVQQRYPFVYKWLNFIHLPKKCHNSANLFNSAIAPPKSHEMVPTITDSLMQSRKSKQFEKEMMKNVGQLTDGKKKIVDHRLDPDTQAAILNEMWKKNVDVQ
uniref:Uncharacterized protein n=1 Tax=Romanomermis culicivorax TaxID=13658 RepID=A0A915J790_ROMCU